MLDITTNLLNLKNQIHAAALKYHRAPESIQLIAVSKNQPISAIEIAYDAGQRAFGENYLQDALPKITALQHKKIEWHFIGALQSNKTKKVAEHFDWVHTVSDIKTAERLNSQRPESLPPLNICIQVNSSAAKNKSGVHANDAVSLALKCAELPRLRIRGLMTVPEAKNNFSEQQEEFKKLRLIWEQLRKDGLEVDTLSMGMSNDLEAAIAEGATMIRIGTKIFGDRF
jgi:pyridoxal phosphate enzyme (YggS family)